MGAIVEYINWNNNMKSILKSKKILAGGFAPSLQYWMPERRISELGKLIIPGKQWKEFWKLSLNSIIGGKRNSF